MNINRRKYFPKNCIRRRIKHREIPALEKITMHTMYVHMYIESQCIHTYVQSLSRKTEHPTIHLVANKHSPEAGLNPAYTLKHRILSIHSVRAKRCETFEFFAIFHFGVVHFKLQRSRCPGCNMRNIRWQSRN